MANIDDSRLEWLENNLVLLAELDDILEKLLFRLGQLSRRYKFIRPVTDAGTGDIAEARAVIQNIALSALELDTFDLKRLRPKVREAFLRLSAIRNGRT